MSSHPFGGLFFQLRDLLRCAPLVGEITVFGPFQHEFVKSLAEHGGGVESEGGDVAVGADKADDGASGKGKGVENALGCVEVIDFGTELGDLTGKDAHHANLIFKGANGGFFET